MIKLYSKINCGLAPETIDQACYFKDALNYSKPRLESELRPLRPLYDLKVLKGIVMNLFFYEFSS